METTSVTLPEVSPCSSTPTPSLTPYRSSQGPEVIPAGPTARPRPWLTYLSLSVSFLALLTVGMTLRMTSLLLDVVNPAFMPAAPATPRRAYSPERGDPGPLLDVARALTERLSMNLFVSPDVSRDALRAPVDVGALRGNPLSGISALAAYGDARGLWVHVQDSVLRVEPLVDKLDWSCQDMLSTCMARLSTLASIRVSLASPLQNRVVHLRLGSATPVVQALRSALVEAGFEVDVRGRSVSAYLPAATPVAAAAPVSINTFPARIPARSAF